MLFFIDILNKLWQGCGSEWNYFSSDVKADVGPVKPIERSNMRREKHISVISEALSLSRT